MSGIHRFKITQITETRFRNRAVQDADGQIRNVQEQYQVYREVKVIKGWARFAHYLIDAIIIGVIQTLVNFLIGFAVAEQYVEPGSEADLILRLKLSGVGMVVTFIYYVVFEIFYASSPGKLLLGRIVIDEYALKPEPGTVMLRSLCRLVPFEAFSCLADRGWHDRWSKTYVVDRDEAELLWNLLGKAERDYTQQEADRYRESQQGPQL